MPTPWNYMNSVDRFNALRLKLNLPAILPYPSTRLHSLLDDLDKRVGIKTRHGCAAAYHAGRVPFPQSEYVGARLARLERHVEASKAPQYFWLGAEGDSEDV